MMRRRQNGGIIWSLLKLLVLVVIAYVFVRTDVHMTKKYLPPESATTPAKSSEEVQ